MFDALADFVVRERVAMDNIFPNPAIRKAVQVMIEKIEHDGPLVILHGVNINTRRSVEAVPAAVVATDQAG